MPLLTDEERKKPEYQQYMHSRGYSHIFRLVLLGLATLFALGFYGLFVDYLSLL